MLQQSASGRINIFGSGANAGKAVNTGGSDPCCCTLPGTKYQLQRCDGALSNYYILIPPGGSPPAGTIIVGTLCYTVVSYVNATSLLTSWTTTTKTCAQCRATTRVSCSCCGGASPSVYQAIDEYSTANVTFGLPGYYSVTASNLPLTSSCQFVGPGTFTGADGVQHPVTVYVDASPDSESVYVETETSGYPGSYSLGAGFYCGPGPSFPSYFATTTARNAQNQFGYITLGISA
jgi:hypothetical protein